jgi:hypothetical protein
MIRDNTVKDAPKMIIRASSTNDHKIQGAGFGISLDSLFIRSKSNRVFKYVISFNNVFISKSIEVK